MASEEWNNFANRFDSYIIHYAGAGVFDNDCSNVLPCPIVDDHNPIIVFPSQHYTGECDHAVVCNQ